jgi:phosphatidylglycerophosphatase C
MKLAIFDFDGTITTKDSFEDFIVFSQGVPKTLTGLLKKSPALMQYLFGSMSNSAAKQEIFAHFYTGWESAKFAMFAEHYVNERLPRIIRPGAREKLQWHNKEGHTIVIVSASFENYLEFWCRKEGLELLATKIEVKDGKFTGNFASPNCHGQEKIRRINAAYNLKDFEYIYAYGDTKGDLPLKTIANEFHYKPFRN